MEVLARIAIFKYYKSNSNKININLGKTTNSILDAIKMLFNISVNNYINKFDCHEWRLSRLWNEECDLVFKYYMVALKALYEKFSGKYAKPG